MGFSQEERARKVIHWLADETGKTQYEIGQLLGYSNKTTLSQFLGGHKPIPAGFNKKLAALDPRINVAYLNGESEEMLILPANEPQTGQISTFAPSDDKLPIREKKVAENGVFVPAELVQMVTGLTDTVREQQDIIKTLVNAWVKGKQGE